MRKLKRIIALVTVAMFLLSLAAPAAMAATKEDAFSRLNALDVAIGDATGNPQYDKNFTRAEAAAIMVNLSGMNAAINAAKGATKFKDVPASHWATGVINLAVGAGIIKGYPDGSYKPENNVTYAEMSAMLIGVLGYTPKLQGTWPSNVIGKAAQLGLLDGVSVNDYNGAALRSNVFVAADNALDTAVLKEMKDGYEEGAALMVDKLNVVKKKEGIVTNVPNYGMAKGKVQVDPDTTVAGDDFTVTVADGVDPNANYGEKVVAWEKDDKVFFFDVKTSSSSIYRDELDAAYIVADDQIDLKAADKKITFAAGATIMRNYVAAAKGALLKGDKVKVVLDGNGKVAYIEAWSYLQALVDEVKASDEKIIFADPAGSLELKDDVVSIIKNGKVATLADVKAGDVIDYLENAAKDITNVYVSDAVKTGKLTAAAQAATFYKLTVGDAVVNSIDLSIGLSDDNGDTYNDSTSSDSFRGYFNKEVTVRLNKDGKAVWLSAASADDSSEFAVLVRDIKNDSGLDTNTYIKAGKLDGTNVNYQVTKDTDIDSKDVSEAALAGATIVSTDGLATLAVNEIVKITLTSDGKVDTIKHYGAELITDANGSMAVSKDNDTITIDTTAYKVTADTKIIKRKAALGEVAAVTWAGVESQVNGANNLVLLGGASTLWAVVDNGKIKNMVILENLASTTDYKYGVIASRGTDADLGTFTEVDINGTYTKHKGAVNAVYGDRTLIQYKVDSDNKISTVTSVGAMTVTGATYSTYIVKNVNKTERILTVVEYDGTNELATKLYPLYDTNIQVYSVKDNKLTDKSIDDLSSGNKVKVYDDLNADGDADSPDGAVDFIILQ